MMNREQIEEGLKKALEYSAGELSLQDVLEGLARNEYALLEFNAGFIVITKVTYPQYNALKVCLAYGILDEELLHIMNVVDALAKDLSCEKVMIEGRRGWARQLAQFGYAEQYVVVTKKVD